MTRITFLGTGTSNGVPQIGCHCPVCSSQDPKDKRYRASILIEKGETKVVVDTGYEFRLQCLRAHIDRLDAVLYTHAHPDHLFGLDDLRVFSKGDTRFPVYTMDAVMDRIDEKFHYAFLNKPNFGIPQLDYHRIEDLVPFQIGELEFIPFSIKHGFLDAVGYRFGDAAYVTDVNDILLEKNRKVLENLDVLIIDGLRERGHIAHYNFQEALAVGEELGARRIFFTHMNHETLHQDIEEKYGKRAHAAYDTLVVEVEN